MPLVGEIGRELAREDISGVFAVNFGPSRAGDLMLELYSEADVALEYRLFQPSLPRIELVREGDIDLIASGGGLIVPLNGDGDLRVSGCGLFVASDLGVVS